MVRSFFTLVHSKNSVRPWEVCSLNDRWSFAASHSPSIFKLVSLEFIAVLYYCIGTVMAPFMRVTFTIITMGVRRGEGKTGIHKAWDMVMRRYKAQHENWAHLISSIISGNSSFVQTRQWFANNEIYKPFPQFTSARSIWPKWTPWPNTMARGPMQLHRLHRLKAGREAYWLVTMYLFLSAERSGVLKSMLRHFTSGFDWTHLRRFTYKVWILPHQIF